MENLKILNKKEVKLILKKIKENFDIKNIDFNYGILRNKDGKIFLISKDINKVNLNKLRVNEIGLYIAKFDKELRLTIEGTQLFGRFCNKNVYEVDKEIAYSWMSGRDIPCAKEFKGFVIVKYDNNYLGTGKWKDDKILNYIPMERRIKPGYYRYSI